MSYERLKFIGVLLALVYRLGCTGVVPEGTSLELQLQLWADEGCACGPPYRRAYRELWVRQDHPRPHFQGAAYTYLRELEEHEGSMPRRRSQFAWGARGHISPTLGGLQYLPAGYKRKVVLLYYSVPTKDASGTHAEWARFLSKRTDREWTSRALREVLKLLTLAQVINATSPHQLNAAQLENAAVRARLVEQPRGAQRYQLTQREDEDVLTWAIVALASQYGRYGFAGSRRY
jgi:hypothetical protein